MRRPRASRAAVSGLLTSSLLAATLTATALPSAAAELPETVDAAAHLGAGTVAGTSLPATLSDGTTDHPVTWEIDADTFAVPYTTVPVTGTVDGGTVTAQVEVLAPAENPLVYFVDAGRNGDSQDRPYSTGPTPSRAFSAVTTLDDGTLVNDVPDQEFVDGETTWGWTSDAQDNYKISVTGGDPDPYDVDTLAAYDKYELGARTNGDAITFRLDLDPGTYTLSSGFFEFYTGGQDRLRGITPVITYTVDGAEQSTTLDEATLSTPAGTESRLLETDAFEIPAGATDVRLAYTRTAGEAPSLSWFAVAAGDAEETIDEAAHAVPAVTTDITVDGADVAADNVHGLTFKGFGVLSANSTSAVLLDYKSEHPEKYAEMLRILFGGDHPVMRHVKIEMGDDRNNSTGSDVATMRTPDEPANVRRHPGFQLAADAIAVNPDVQVSILRWNAVPWADTNDKIYDWYKNTILAAYREYGYMVDYVNPGVNEHAADLGWTKEYAERVRTDSTGYVSDDAGLAGFRDGEAELFHQIQVVISDEVGTGTFGDEMVADAALREAVDVAGFHYNTNDDGGGHFTRLAEEFDTEIWNSEAQATFSNSSFRQNNNVADPTSEGTGIGGTGSSLEMANTIVKGFVNSRRTHFVYQPAIGSFYEGGQYSFKELVSARDPWSGWMHYDAGLAVLQHFSSFAVTGWENADNTAGVWRAVPEASTTTASGTNPVNGRNGGPNYLTLAAPDASDFSTVLVNDSEFPRAYRITPENLDLGADPTLAVWETRAAEDGEAFDSRYKQHVADLTADLDGAYTLTVAPFSIATVTSLDVTGDAGWTTPLPVEGERTVLDARPEEGVLWSDDFDYTGKTVPVVGVEGTLTDETEDFTASRGGDTGAIPLYTWDRNGSFEAFLADDGERVLRQQVDREGTGVGGAWNGGDPITAVGDRRWTNYRATVDVRFERAAASDNYAVLGARSSGGGSSNNLNGTPYALKLVSDGTWQLVRYGTVLESGSLDGFDAAAWHELSVRAAGDEITGWIDGDEVFSWTDPSPVLSGWVDLASGFHWTQFDDLTVERVDDEVPHYGEYLDGLETNDLADPPATELVYGGEWRHANGGSMYEYMRSTSTSQGEGASLTYTFTGSGLDVLGPNDGSARLDVTVDGEPVAVNAATRDAGHFQQAFELRGLPWGEHTVTLTVTSGTLLVDAVGVISSPASGATDAAALAEAVAAAEAVERTDDFTDTDWAVLQRNVADARAAVADPGAYRLTGHGADQLVDRLRAASAPVAARIVGIEPVSTATYVGETPSGLPETLEAELADGTTREVPITWDLDSVSFDDEWATVLVPGSYGVATTQARVEVVPTGTVAFADVNGTADGTLGYDSPSYLAIDGLVGGLLNESPDQVRTDGADWGHWGQNAGGNRAINYKGIVAGDYSKTSTTGMYTSNQVGAEVSYTITLPAGSHTIVAESHTWWAAWSRSADVFLDYDGESHEVGSFTLDTGNPTELLSHDVELAEDGPVTIRLRATNNQSPMLSWAAVVTPPVEVTPERPTWTDECGPANVTGAPLPVVEGVEYVETRKGDGGVKVVATPLPGYVLTDKPSPTKNPDSWTWTKGDSGLPCWDAGTRYEAGDLVGLDGSLWEALRESEAKRPGEHANGPWQEIVETADGTAVWTESRVFVAGDVVVADGERWVALHRTRGQVPAESPDHWAPEE
ncbi:Ig-like domain-containing protein [Isoptericola sp. AK164]|uniref:Ig-like domain-containing protein n=1 Tax=Isoptericola sp. AK164 TaxID=3024246 RepID=UPI0024183D73|nr:Ig-like domain-containing protein [Isoptericola sp. AK164]